MRRQHICEAWNEFQRTVLPPNIGEIQRTETRPRLPKAVDLDATSRHHRNARQNLKRSYSEAYSMSPIQGFLEVIDQPIYDTLHTLAPRHPRRSDRESMFIIPYGGMHETKKGLMTKTYEDTNMAIGGMLPQPSSFEVKNIRCALLGRRLFPCDSRYYRDLWIELLVSDKTAWRGPGWRCVDPATMMVNPAAWLALPPEERTELITLLRRPLDPVIHIHPNQDFVARVTFGPAWEEAWYAAPDRLVLLLEGKLARAIL